MLTKIGEPRAVPTGNNGADIDAAGTALSLMLDVYKSALASDNSDTGRSPLGGAAGDFLESGK
jgi:hypothetical protein